jgi:hypothetical protein
MPASYAANRLSCSYDLSGLARFRAIARFSPCTEAEATNRQLLLNDEIIGPDHSAAIG